MQLPTFEKNLLYTVSLVVWITGFPRYRIEMNRFFVLNTVLKIGKTRTTRETVEYLLKLLYRVLPQLL